VWDFLKTSQASPPLFKTDLHSHLLPGLDDGVKSFDEVVSIISTFQNLGFTKAITTPHIMSDYYKNSPAGIRQKMIELKEYLSQHNIVFNLECAAEYYFDETLLDLIQSGDEILTFGESYLLFETNTFAEPFMLDDLIFKLKVKNIKPVLAHPERYQYLQNNLSRVEDLINRGVYMQINSLSLIGFYSKPIQKMARQLIDNKMIHFLGSDCHNPDQARHLNKCLSVKHFKKALNLPLLNYKL
jgi:tyrosine-protein phosphatase YwqE